MDYSRMLEKILTTSEFSHLKKAKQISDDYTAMQYLEDRLVICVTGINDCDGERIFSFIDQRLNKFSDDGMLIHEINPINPSQKNYLSHKDRLLSFTMYCLQYYDNALKRDGLRIVLTSTPGDFLPFMVVKSENVDLLSQMKTDYWKFHTPDEE